MPEWRKVALGRGIEVTGGTPSRAALRAVSNVGLSSWQNEDWSWEFRDEI